MINYKKLILCDYCGKEHYKPVHDFSITKNNFCSRSCWGKFKTQQGTITKECLWCGKEFICKKFQTSVNYCSVACFKEYKKSLGRRSCKTCGRTFYTVPSVPRQFCSTVCRGKSLETLAACTCQTCHKVFYKIPSKAKKARFCSITCSGKFDTLMHDAKVEKECCICHKKLLLWPSNIKKNKTNTFYCSLHKEKHLSCVGSTYRFKKGQTAWNKDQTHLTNPLINNYSGKNNGNWRGGLSNLPYAPEFTEAFKKQIRKRDNYTCQECHQTEKQLGYQLHCHHIDYNKLNTDPSNFVSLCRSCHSQTNYKRADWTKYYKEIVNG